MGIEPNNILIHQSIVLVGLMGCGKTVIGSLLAKRLNLDFVDTDMKISQSYGLSIKEIFEKYGEPSFRQKEREVLHNLLSQPPSVIATGGGAFLDPETRKTMNNSCISIWLKTEIEILLPRLLNSKDRPLLKNGNIAQILEKLAAERYPIYEQAHITIDPEKASLNKTVLLVIQNLENYIINKKGTS